MHTSSTLVLVLAVFAASLVEMVEALTIVVAAGVSRGWRPALEGAAAALCVLGVLVVVVGVPLIRYIPIDTLRVLVGALLLVLGLSWLRKAILRASGHKDPHDEDKIFAATVAELRARTAAEDERRPRRRGAHDGVGFAVAFKGVFLEGTEVVLIVVSLGAAQHRLALPRSPRRPRRSPRGHRGLLVARQLSEVPENTIKTVVGVMLTSFGVFWVGEGAGVHWPGSDLAIPVLVGFFVVVFFAFTAFMRTQLPDQRRGRRGPRRRRRDRRRAGPSGPSATSGGTSSSATRPSWPWPPAHRRSGLPAGGHAVGAILLPLTAAGFLFLSTYRGRRPPGTSVPATPSTGIPPPRRRPGPSDVPKVATSPGIIQRNKATECEGQPMSVTTAHRFHFGEVPVDDLIHVVPGIRYRPALSDARRHQEDHERSRPCRRRERVGPSQIPRIPANMLAGLSVSGSRRRFAGPYAVGGVARVVCRPSWVCARATAGPRRPGSRWRRRMCPDS